MDGNLTEEQQAKLDDDSLNRQPIGADEILLVGDIRYGIPILKRYFDDMQDADALLNALREHYTLCADFRAWTRTSPEESFRTLMEVQRLRELVREAESAVIAG